MARDEGHPLTFRHYFWAIVRVAMGLIFLWAFFDKLIGLGFAQVVNIL